MSIIDRIINRKKQADDTVYPTVIDRKAHREAILADLMAGQEITSLDALERYGCMRLAARIKELRDAGYVIDTITAPGHRYATYKLIAAAA